MNKDRRKQLQTARVLMMQAQSIIQKVKADEEIAFDNLSEGLQQTMRGETMEENVEVLEEIDDAITDILEQFDDVE